jgi:hypothetical protein
MGTGIGTLMPTMPACTSCSKRRAGPPQRPRHVLLAGKRHLSHPQPRGGIEHVADAAASRLPSLKRRSTAMEHLLDLQLGGRSSL